MKTLPANIDRALARSGLQVRGGFNFTAGETAPEGPRGRPAKSVLLAGHGGGWFWRFFRQWLDALNRAPDNPLDKWSRHVLGAIARECGARAVYPSDIPYLPFQQWAMRGEGLKPSPLGILIHPEYGLWHAYRGALLFDHEFQFAKAENPIHLCERCAGKPCQNSCPAGAVSETGYVVEPCRSHVGSWKGAECRTGGCIARNACPFGSGYRYSPEQQAFHMAAFLRGRA